MTVHAPCTHVTPLRIMIYKHKNVKLSCNFYSFIKPLHPILFLFFIFSSQLAKKRGKSLNFVSVHAVILWLAYIIFTHTDSDRKRRVSTLFTYVYMFGFFFYRLGEFLLNTHIFNRYLSISYPICSYPTWFSLKDIRVWTL